ncbi:uncharacterized protein LOC135075178 [Ostrinia nubilalis]|uniref:uncharacterized protein LOC135075178 n=1 Tax=Ostrinia nubilalis TaxID=29057 RepID=UPI0030825E4C
MPHRKISRGPPELMTILFEVASNIQIKDIEYVLEFGCDEVDCYYGGLYKVTITGYRNGCKVKKKYIIKWHSDPKKRNAFRKAHKREFLFYQKIIPAYLEIQNRFKVIEGLKTKFPNCDFACCDKGREAIVVSETQGYKVHDRFQKLSLDHVSLAVKNLAKLHALSFVLEKSQPEKFEEIKKACYFDVQYADVELMPKSLFSYYEVSVNVVKDASAKKKLQDNISNVLRILHKCAMPDTKYSTICHGDCWNNNILYKYQKSRPVDVMFIDCQLLRYASPVTDISYYLYMTTDHEFRLKYYDHVLSLYYWTLSAVLRQCDWDINEIYPESIFQQHLKDYSVFGLIEALISMKIITAEIEDAHKMTEVKYELTEEGSCGSELQNSLLYEQRVNGVVNDFFSRNYSLDAVLSK